MEGYAETGCRQHWQVVGTVAYGYGLRYVDVLDLGYEFEQLGFASSVDDIAEMTARGFTVDNFQLLSIRIAA